VVVIGKIADAVARVLLLKIAGIDTPPLPVVVVALVVVIVDRMLFDIV
jgi:hypothetical protein